MIDKNQTLHIAKLARLELTEDEVTNFTGQLGSVISYINLLDGADTAGVEPTCFIDPSHDPLRDDIEAPSLPADTLFANAPAAKKGHFAIPKVIGGAK
jgi:aspartyl-tRNA(Asn)/glutamyl-tRNA(Gln) amidotransferase subunit C